MNTYITCTITIIISIVFFLLFLSKVKKIDYFTNFLIRNNNKIKSWKKVKGQIKKRGIGLNYTYPFSSISDNIDEKKIRQAKKNLRKYGDILIKYTYTIDGKEYTKRTIGPLINSGDYDFLYSLNTKKTIDVYINPENFHDSYLRFCSEQEIHDFINGLIIKTCPLLALSGFFAAISIVCYCNDYSVFMLFK